MQVPTNNFKRALAERRLQIGLWSQLCSNLVAEVLAHAGFDWVLIDCEHAPNELPAVFGQLQGLAAGPSSAIVRLPWSDQVMSKRALDIGAQSLLLPYIETEEQARRAVAHTRYPPAGVRGVAGTHRANHFGRVPDYFATAADQICVLVQIETRTGMDNVEAIAAVEGVDGLFIGPADLAASFGHLGNPGHPDVQAAIATIHERVTKAGKPTGILSTAEPDIRRFIEMGFSFIAVGSDLGLLARGADKLAATYKNARPS